MTAAFLDLLVHPIHKTPLRFDEKLQQLADDNSKDNFVVKNGVPILVVSTLQQALTETEKNRDAHTTFSYKEHYQNDAEVYDYGNEQHHPVEQTEINFLRKNILKSIPKNAKTVLDIGCGGAWLAASLLHTNKTVISTDISDVNPIKAIKNFPAPHHFGLVADVFELPLKPNSIDCIVASEIIEHVPDPKRFLQCLFTVLQPGGTLIVTTPYNELIRTSLCIHCNHETPHNAHLHSFTEKNILPFLPSASEVNIELLNSKLLVKTRTQYFLRFLPISLWKVIDTLVISITGKKAFRLKIVLKK